MTLDQFLDSYIPTGFKLTRPSPIVVVRDGLVVPLNRLEWSIGRCYTVARRAGVFTTFAAIRAAYKQRATRPNQPQRTN